MERDLLTSDFLRLSARLGQDPLQVQGPGGNTSIKSGDVMWIKASGTELANAEHQDIFVAVDRNAANAEAHGSGDGSCKNTVLSSQARLRPSIETTFHAALDWPVVLHTHSIATLTHAISPQGRKVVEDKLQSLNAVLVPYAKPGLPLTREILSRTTPQTRAYVLENHGLIVTGTSVEDASNLLADVESRLTLPVLSRSETPPGTPPPEGFEWSDANWLATDSRLSELASYNSYYPDHVVFLGPGLNPDGGDASRPVRFLPGLGVALRKNATPSQRAMLTCLSDVLSRLPQGWHPEPIGAEAEASLLNWDAEKYRQALAARK